jgi:hypothetical protein
MKKYFMREIKTNAYKELKLYYKNIALLYDIFSESKISNNENDVFLYIKMMKIDEINEMYDTLLAKCERLNIMDCYTNPLLFKFMVIQYVLEIINI